MGKTRQRTRHAEPSGARHQKREQRKETYETHLVCRVCGKALQSITWGHLQLHGMTPCQYKERYNETYLQSPHLRVRLSRAKSRRSRPGIAGYRPWESRTEIRLALLSLARRLGWPGRDVSTSELYGEDPSLVRQAVRVFGTMVKVKEACGFRIGCRRRWTSRKAVVEALRRCAGTNGLISHALLKKRDPALGAAAARRYFGSIPAAARKLGLVYKARRETWSAGRVRKSIKRMFKKGEPVNPMAVTRQDRGLHQAAAYYYGSWRSAIEASGLDYFRVRGVADRSPKALKRDLKKWVREHGPLNYRDLNASDMALCSAVVRIFGGAERAARALGLPFESCVPRWDKARVRRRIRELRRKGDALNARAMSVRGKSALLKAGMHLFGCWDKALKSAGVDATSVRKSVIRSPENLENALRAWVRRHGALSYAALRRTDPALCSAMEKRFGGAASTARALGLPYEARKTDWSKALVLQRIMERYRAGKALNSAAINRECATLLAAAIRYFGTLDDALRAAGIDPATVRKRA